VGAKGEARRRAEYAFEILLLDLAKLIRHRSASEEMDDEWRICSELLEGGLMKGDDIGSWRENRQVRRLNGSAREELDAIPLRIQASIAGWQEQVDAASGDLAGLRAKEPTNPRYKHTQENVARQMGMSLAKWKRTVLPHIKWSLSRP